MKKIARRVHTEYMLAVKMRALFLFIGVRDFHILSEQLECLTQMKMWPRVAFLKLW